MKLLLTDLPAGGALAQSPAYPVELSGTLATGTTIGQAMQEIQRRFKIDFRLTSARDHAESYAQLEAGKADAFASDDVLLYGLVAQHKAQGQFQVVGEFLSYDPYGIMFRKGDA